MVMALLPVEAGRGAGPAGRETSEGTQEGIAEAASPSPG